MNNLVSHFKNLISNDLFLKLSIYLEEKDTLLRQTIEVCICTVLVGVKRSNDIDVLLLSLKESDVSFEEQFNVFSVNETLFVSGQVYLDGLFPVKRERISEMISNEICVKSESARIIFNLVALLILINLKNNPPKNLLPFLDTQVQALYGFIPRGVRLVLGIPNLDYVTDHIPEKKLSFFGKLMMRSKRN
jgi:hypothetical protein